MKIALNSRSTYFAAALLVGTAAFFLAVSIANQGEAAVRGLSVGSIDISALARQDATQRLREALNEYTQSKIEIAANTGTSLKVTVQDFGIQPDTENTLEYAFAWGRDSSYLKNLLSQAWAATFGKNIQLRSTWSDAAYENFTSTMLSAIHNPAKNAHFIYNIELQSWEFIEAREGTAVDTDVLRKYILTRIGNMSNADISIKQSIDLPLVYSEGRETALARANQFLQEGPYIIHEDNNSWEVERDDLIEWISFVPRKTSENYEMHAEISPEKVGEYLERFAPGLNTAPVNAEFAIQDGRVNEFRLSEPGRELMTKESAAAIKEMIEIGANRGELIFRLIEPAITSEEVNDLGITDLIGRGETDFSGSPANRIHNIQVGSNQYHGLIIAPGEEFSFNETLGPVTAAEGYLPELVIKDNKTIPEYGGGLCQVSTTLFRAALNSGLEITQRTNHAYPVRYYGTPGLDATIYPPNPDLKFRNNMPGHILIQYKVEGTKLSFEIYGKDDGRTVEIVGPVIYDKKPDGSLKAWVKQIVRNRDGNTIEEKTFYSGYKSPLLYPIDRNPLE